MDWFKHSTVLATHDPRIADIIEEFGAAGYGRYHILLEILLGSTADWSVVPEVAFTPKQWADKLITKPNTVLEFLLFLHKNELIICSLLGDQPINSCWSANQQVHENHRAPRSQKISVKLCNYSKLLPKGAKGGKGHLVEREKERTQRSETISFSSGNEEPDSPLAKDIRNDRDVEIPTTLHAKFPPIIANAAPLSSKWHKGD